MSISRSKGLTTTLHLARLFTRLFIVLVSQHTKMYVEKSKLVCTQSNVTGEPGKIARNMEMTRQPKFCVGIRMNYYYCIFSITQG